MHRFPRYRLLAGALITTAILAAPRGLNAQAPLTIQTTMPTEGAILNACSQEFVQYSGTVSLLVHFSESSSGSITTKTQQRIQGSGVGLSSGNEYRVFQIDDSETTGPKPAADGQFETTDTNNNDVNGPRPDDHFILQFKSHITVRPGGLITAVVSDFKSCCPGADGTLSCRPIIF